MSRPTDWSAVGWDRDPIPGDSTVVAAAARQYRSTAEAVGASINNLDRIDAANMKGEAITAVLDRIKQVRGQLYSVEGRVAGAATALEIYHPVLASTQVDSERVLREAEGYRAEEEQAVRSANEAAERHNTSNDPNMKSDAKVDYDKANDAAARAAASLRAAKDKIQNAVSQRDSAADRAIAYLQDIDAQSPVHDTFWDKFTDACGKAADWIEKNLKPILDKIQVVLDIASIVCLVAAVVLSLTGVGAPIAAFLFAASNVLSIASLAITGFNTILVGFMKAVSGRQSWGAFLGSAALFAGTIVVSKILGAKMGNAAVSRIGKAAVSQKSSVIRKVASALSTKAGVKAVKEVANKAAEVIVDKTVEAGKWAYENVVKPLTSPQQVPQQQYRLEHAGAGGGGGGGYW